MARLVEIRSRIVSMQELDDVVGALRALSAVRMRQALASLDAIRTYANTIGDAIAWAGSLLPPVAERGQPSAARTAVVVFCTEHGFAGALNERLLERARDDGAALLVVGTRGALVASDARRDVAWSTAGASHPAGVLEVARRIATELYQRVERGTVDVVDVVYGRGGTSGSTSVERERLLPPDLSRRATASDGAPPIHHVPAATLADALAGELVLAELMRMAMESLAAENAARLYAMSSARENVERKLARLRQDEHAARQEQVTMDLIDVVTGAEALRHQRDSR